ncbi:MAG TPA: class I SAM-dependent methyltransferase [Micromonosporaceae bacterium]
MTGQPDLGEVQQTLYIPLLSRAAYTRSGGPLLRDPKAVEIVEALDPDRQKFGGTGDVFTVLRTAIYDYWVSQFLKAHPSGTVVELGSGLNSRFERVDNGEVRWFDVDLPDTVAVRRRFFADSDRRHTVAASVADTDWMDPVTSAPGPYFLVSEGVLVYLRPEDATRSLRQIAERFAGSQFALDTYTASMMRKEHSMAAKRHIARWQWACDDPRELEPLGLRVRDSASYRRPPEPMRKSIPLRHRALMSLVDRAAGGMVALTLFDLINPVGA